MATVVATPDMIGPGVFNRSELNDKFGTEQLREYLKSQNLQHTGKKSLLIRRILDHHKTLTSKPSPKTSPAKAGDKPIVSPKSPTSRSSPSRDVPKPVSPRDKSPSRKNAPRGKQGKGKSQESTDVPLKAKSTKAPQVKEMSPKKNIEPKLSTPVKQASPKRTSPAKQVSPKKPTTPIPSPSTKKNTTPSKTKPSTPKSSNQPKTPREKSPARNKAANQNPSIDVSAAKSFFGFHPVSFFDDVINAITDCWQDGADDLEKALGQAYPKDATMISKAVTDFLTETRNQVSTNFDLFELYGLRNVFNVPPGLKAEATLQPKHSTKEAATVDRDLSTSRQVFVQKTRELQIANRQLTVEREHTASLNRLVAAMEDLKRLSPDLSGQVIDLAQRLHQEVRRLQGQLQDSALVASLSRHHDSTNSRLDSDIELLGKDLAGPQ